MVVLGGLVPGGVITRGYGDDFSVGLLSVPGAEVCLASIITLEYFAVSPTYLTTLDMSWVEFQVLLASPSLHVGSTDIELSSAVTLEITLDSIIPACK